tara:strand:+ start:36 stop:674 length:639 start_codon:yes stop_codon:yes gene_type:complete
MAVGGTIGTFFVLTLAYFWGYYKIIIKKKIDSEEGKGNVWVERILHLGYFVFVIGLQIANNISSFNAVCPGNISKVAGSITIWTVIANVVTFGLVILGLLLVKQFSYPFEYTFGNIGCARMFRQLREKLEASGATKYLNRWQSCIDITADDPEKYRADIAYDEVYKILCRIVMVRKAISAFIWYILVGIYAITKSNYYTITHECPGPEGPTD